MSKNKDCEREKYWKTRKKLESLYVISCFSRKITDQQHVKLGLCLASVATVNKGFYLFYTINAYFCTSNKFTKMHLAAGLPGIKRELQGGKSYVRGPECVTSSIFVTYTRVIVVHHFTELYSPLNGSTQVKIRTKTAWAFDLTVILYCRLVRPIGLPRVLESSPKITRIFFTTQFV